MNPSKCQSSFPVWSGDYCDLPLYFVLVRRHSPDQLTNLPTQSQSSVSLSRRSSLVAQNLFRKKKSTANSNDHSNSPLSSGSSKNGDNPAFIKELAVYVNQLILALPNAYREQLKSPYPQTIEEYMDALLRVLPKEWPELASSAALNRMTALRYPSFASFQHFLWEFRRLKLVAQCSDRKAFLIFLAIIPTDLRIAISRSGINHYSQLIRVEEYDQPSTKMLISDPRNKKSLRLDLHKDRLLFALHIPSRLFNKVIKSKHKLIDSIAMSWASLSLENDDATGSPAVISRNTHRISQILYDSENGVTKSSFEDATGQQRIKKSPSYVHIQSSSKSMPLFVRAAAEKQTDTKNTPENNSEVIICDNIIFYNGKLHLNQGLITSIIKHWYHCFTSSIQQADIQIFDLLVGNSFSYKPFFDFSNIIQTKPGCKSKPGAIDKTLFLSKNKNKKIPQKQDPLKESFGKNAQTNNASFSQTTGSVVEEEGGDEGLGYYRPWQVVKMSYVSGSVLSNFANSLPDMFHLQNNNDSNSRNTSRSNSGRSQDSHKNFSVGIKNGGISRAGTGSSQHTSHSTNEKQSTREGVRRADSHISTSSEASSYYPSLFSETASSGTISSTHSSSSLIEEEEEDDDEEEELPPPKDIIIITCCETLEVFFGVIDPSDPPAAIIQTVLIPFAHQYGYPLAVLTDRSASARFFTSQLFQKFWKAHGTSCFHLATQDQEGTSIAEIHISFIKTYLACFAQELQVQKSRTMVSEALARNTGQNGKTSALGSGLQSKRPKTIKSNKRANIIDVTVYKKRLMATLNDLISYYDTNIDAASATNGFAQYIRACAASSAAKNGYPENIVGYYTREFEEEGNMSGLSDGEDEWDSDDDSDEADFLGSQKSNNGGSNNNVMSENNIFYKTLNIALKKFTNVSQMFSAKCMPAFEYPISHENLADWPIAVPWKLAPTAEDQVSRTNAESLETSDSTDRKSLPTYHHSYLSPNRESQGAQIYEDYKRSLMTNGLPRESVFRRNTTTAATSHRNKTQGKRVQKPLRNHVVIHGKIMPIEAILGYCEYLSIPCFLIQTNSGLSWVTGFQLSECSNDLQGSIRSIYTIRSQPVPESLKFLTNQEVHTSQFF